MRTSTSVLSCCLTLTLALASPSLADKPDARTTALKHFDVANAFMERGRFADAAGEYSEAYAALGSAEFLYDAALAYDKAGARADALTSYRKFLSVTQGGDRMAIVKARVAILDREQAEVARARETPRHTPLPYTEPATKRVFQTSLVHDGKEFALVGVGVRKVIGFSVYAMGLYLEDAPARTEFPRLVTLAGGADGATLAASVKTGQFVASGRFGKLAILDFTRTVERDKLRSAYRDSLAADLDKAPAEVKKAAEAFIALFDRDAREGESITIHSDGNGRVEVGYGSAPLRAAPASLRLEEDLWDVWLGPKPISEDMRKALVGRMDALAR